MSVFGESGSGGPSANSADDILRWIHERPLPHFIYSELMAGIASVTVYTFFLLVSYLTEMVTAAFPLKYAAPAHFLDMIFAWGTAFSGGITFSMISAFSLIRLGRQLWQEGARR